MTIAKMEMTTLCTEMPLATLNRQTPESKCHGQRLPGPGIQCRHDGFHFGVDSRIDTRQPTIDESFRRRLKDPTDKYKVTTESRDVRGDGSELEDTEVGGRRLTSSH